MLLQNKWQEIVAIIFLLFIIFTFQTINSEVTFVRNHIINKHPEYSPNSLNSIIKYETENYKDISGFNYLYGYDSWAYYYHTQNILDGKKIPNEPHIFPLTTAYFHRIAQKINKNTSLVSSCQYYGLFLHMLTAIIIYVILCLVRVKNILIRFATVLIFVFHKQFYWNSFLGFYDTNFINHFLSVLSVLFFLLILKMKYKKWWFYTSIIGMIVISWTFYNSWSGWFYIYVIILVSIIPIILIEKIKWYYKTLLTVPIIGGMILFLKNRSIWYRIQSYGSQIWERDYITSERRYVGLYKLVSMVGVIYSIFFCIGLYKLIKDRRREDIFLLVWAFVTFCAGLYVERFTYFFVIPFVIIVGVSFQFLYNKYKNEFSYDSTKKIFKNIFFVSLFVLVFGIMLFHQEKYTQKVPDMEDSMWSSIEWLRNETPQNAFIWVWWDNGHMYRNTYKDVSGAGSPTRTKEMCKMLLTSNQTLSEKIFKSIGNRPTYLVVISDYLVKIPRHSFCEYTYNEQSILNHLIVGNGTGNYLLVFSKKGFINDVFIYTIEAS